jgi:hypothetical protein
MSCASSSGATAGGPGGLDPLETGFDVCDFHHPLAGLEGCPQSKRRAVEARFESLYSLLAWLLSHAVDVPLEPTEGACAGLWCLWCVAAV